MADPLRPEAHHNNTDVPDADETLYLTWQDSTGQEGKLTVTLAKLKTYPQTEYDYSYTTDHGDHGPYLLQGVALRDLLAQEVAGDWLELEVLSADGFGNRLSRYEVFADKPPMLYYLTDGELLSREHGLVRLVVPSETDNALRQIKWVREVRVKPVADEAGLEAKIKSSIPENPDETAYLMASPENARRLNEGIKAFAEGRDVLEGLELFIED